MHLRLHQAHQHHQVHHVLLPLHHLHHKPVPQRSSTLQCWRCACMLVLTVPQLPQHVHVHVAGSAVSLRMQAVHGASIHSCMAVHACPLRLQVYTLALPLTSPDVQYASARACAHAFPCCSSCLAVTDVPPHTKLAHPTTHMYSLVPFMMPAACAPEPFAC